MIDYEPLGAGRISDDPVLRGLPRHKLFPAIARNAWLKKKGHATPEFDYDAHALLQGNLKRMVPFWIWKYRLTFWARSGWRRRFLLTHPALLEKTGHFLYYFPSTVPGWLPTLKTVKGIARILQTAVRK